MKPSQTASTPTPLSHSPSPPPSVSSFWISLFRDQIRKRPDLPQPDGLTLLCQPCRPPPSTGTKFGCFRVLSPCCPNLNYHGTPQGRILTSAASGPPAPLLESISSSSRLFFTVLLTPPDF
ncbi:unnamed protein product [Pleuronectes platessa]|uniref:Uncharacterized protein n=1 Tax=Pleuronectes platessa TaxID=8262 RepID=A0A9N7Y8U1_PLEPL|nr:unnamed protein product [Pleuronectes platessa]